MTHKNKNILRFCLFLIIFISFSNGYSQDKNRDIYEIKIYHIDNKQQEDQVDSFLKNAYIPAIHRAGVKKVGVFKPLEEDSLFGKRIYVLTPYESIEQFIKAPKILEKDKNYIIVGKDYMDASHDNPPYERIETIVLHAFKGMPHFRETNLTNAPEERIYELRSYESSTEKLFKNKVDMFNKGEMNIFTDLKFNPVFFGEVLAGHNMPNLMYMTAFKDKASREAHWKAFTENPDWEKMKSLKKYQKNVSRSNIYLLHPTPYSEI